MTDRNEPRLPDESLDRLARQWFVEARAQHPEKPASEPQEGAAGEVGTRLLDWLFDAGDADGDGGD